MNNNIYSSSNLLSSVHLFTENIALNKTSQI